jgi:photosystem II stability/assembly factor-like uncharacterized protein
MLDASTGWVCGDGGTLLKTNNGGENWTPVPVTGNNLNSILFKDVNTGIAVGNNGVIIRTTNGGANWSAVTSGTTEQFRKVSSGAGNVVIAAGDNGLASVSVDNGASWTLRNAGTTARFRGSAAAGPNKVWAAGENGLIRYSSDGGVSWTTQISGITTDDLHDIQFINESVGFSGGSGSNFIFTNNGGQTWTPRNSGIFFGLNGIYFKNENIGWGVSIAGTIFFTTNGGVSWTSQPCGSSSTLKEAYFINQGRGWTVGESGTIIMYDNPNLPVELSSFSATVTSSSVVLSWSTASEINNRGFEIERKVSSSQSSVNSSEFESIGFVDGRGNTTEQTQYSFDDKNLSAGKYLYRLKQIDFNGSFEYFNLSSEVTIEAPQSFSLEQNYPNPFNPSTKIKYSVAPNATGQMSSVVLKVYDAIGNEVATLVNENKPAGNYEITFDASNLSSGIYLYKLQAGSFVETKKMLMIK